MIEFSGIMEKSNQKSGVISIKVNEPYYDRVKKQLSKLFCKNAEEGVKVVISQKYNQKTFKQNNFIWLIYDLTADIVNYGKVGPGMKKPIDIYMEDIRNYARKIPTVIEKEFLEDFREKFYVFDDQIQELEDGKIRIICHNRLSKFTKEQACQWIDMLLMRLGTLDIPEEKTAPARLRWEEFQAYQNDIKYVRFREQVGISQQDYKDLTPICEMCGYSITEGGSIHHISARGMGGNQEVWKEQPANWLHLHDFCHNYIHSAGVKTTMEEYPWLENKIKKAQKLGAKKG